MFSLLKKKKDVLIVVLTSSDSKRLYRCYKTLLDSPKKISFDIEIMINTLDKNYPEKVRKLLKDEGVDIYESESNGTSGQGGNCVLEHFRNHKKIYDYLMIVDGDDFFYPCAFEQLEKVLKHKPDIIGLQATDTILEREQPKNSEFFHHLKDNIYLHSWNEKEKNLNVVFPKDVTQKVSEQQTPDSILFMSKRFLTEGKAVSYYAHIPAYSDYIFTVSCYFKALQEGYSYIHTSNSYIYIYDRVNQNAVTKNVKDTRDKVNQDFYKAIEPYLKQCGGNIDLRIIPFIILEKPKNYTTEQKIDFVKKNLIY